MMNCYLESMVLARNTVLLLVFTRRPRKDKCPEFWGVGSFEYGSPE
jgi:hypothetical protein